MTYSSKRRFKIWAYTVSHNSLLLRSPMKGFDEDGYSTLTDHNIDIEFLGVEYMNIPTILEDITIEKLSNYNNLVNDSILSIIENTNSNVFEISACNTKFYIVASVCVIGKNKWLQEDRIFNYESNLEHDEILAVWEYS